MHTRRGPTAVLTIALSLASFACSDANGSGPNHWPSACEGCTEVLSDSALKPAAVAADTDTIYVLKSQTSEIVAASFETKQSRVLSDSVPRAGSFFLRDEALWVTAYDAGNGSLWKVETGTGATTHLPELSGLFAAALGPDNTPVAGLRANRGMRVVTLADDGTITKTLWQLDDTDEFFRDFTADSSGIAWTTSAPAAATLYFCSDLNAAPVSVEVRLAEADTLTVASGTASVLAATSGGSSVFTLTGSQLTEQSPLSADAMGMRTLGNSLLVTSLAGREVAALDSSGKVLASQTLTRPLNIPATADSRYVYLPFEDAIAIFPRVGKWL